ncbi:DUF3653 domain-containing protein [Cognatiluteimonas weifangensis]|uniref:Uncharacterized protein n=1 Tax=Cognatiluteimonas weifangensis TaxID=2303539 RepID=A0A372DNP5_9GAMM|nr:DUF3653 domain-containing protein [Luteimonas weifangensis]RFP61203.1 hypothetical protein D0Y53_05655 [Luteimonas weifangensis]
MMDRPPCWPDDQTQRPNACAHAQYARVIHNITPLYGPWAGWRMAGRVLVSPDGDRISPERLRGLLWRENLRICSTGRTRSGRRSLVAVAKLPARGHFADDD